MGRTHAVGERLAIVGGDAAGMSAASAARRRDPDLEIVAIERGPYTSYSACGIPYYLAGLFEDPDRLISRSADEHRARGIDVRVRHEVTGIDLDARTLTVREHNERREHTEPFDQLVIATGAEAIPPPIEGAEVIEPIRTVDAAERFRRSVERGGSTAVIIGAGYIGLEMAEALVQRNVDVTLVDRADQVFPSLDPDMARHVQDAAEATGVRVLLSVDVERIETGPEGRCRAVVTSAGRIPADHVVIGAGARPVTGLAEQAGLEIGPSRALRVDDRQRCVGHDGVFAAGDCAESTHRLTGRPVNVQLGTHANKQGRIAGVNATGGDARFPGVIATAVSRICKYEVGRTGLGEREAAEAGFDAVAERIKATTRAGYFPGTGPIWVKLVAERGTGRLLGGQIVGVEGAAKRIDVLATAIWSGMSVHEMELLDLSYAPPVSPVYDPVLVAARQTAKAATSGGH